MKLSEHSIQVHNLAKRFGGFTAVDDVSFSVRAGEIFGFLGANGAGKTTTIKMLCGLLQSTSGTATVGGHDINRESDRVKRAIGYMSQRFSLYEDLSVAENLTFFGGVYGLSDSVLRERREWAVAMAGLQGRERSLARELAGGMRQRLALGCAVLHRPGIVFLDEPTGGVDPVSRRRFWDLIGDLSAGGTTVFVTTHYLDEAEYCHTIMLMHAGRIVAGGSPGSLKAEHIRNPILEVESPDAIAALDAIQGQDWAKETSIFGTSLHVSVDDAVEGERLVRRTLAERGIPAARIGRVTPTLEDVFIQVIEQQT
ncbi:MAG: ABC transporter ATP-binding protein [Candidatus Edwardsbacteria bacterium]|jgi:ABC-2 type transport system ATP-binding protein|nr:ABC transporter ATP-binding protein [Candidatus Edwardsbacteria bacterium]